ncbi:hypothetical protein [Methylobacterium sp. WSM2598]|uniref:hypothetical protein n=1 Tax=Methylobacterium sp. WSM2598 TaxID=398261 RepID=UPI0003A8F762|nr:hypothetical protein [Methylobacterium sp. WSM2598]
MCARTALCALTALAPFAAAASGATGERLAWRIVREHRLLTSKQLSCSVSMVREDSTQRLIKIGFYEKHDVRCGGDPSVVHRLFDLEIDVRTGRARWDNTEDLQMRPVPSRAEGARVR